MSTDARSEIIKAIAATTDQNLKTVLLLLLGVLEELGGKIDAMRADEVGLKEAVLNGHSDKHNKHHDWIEERMGSDCDEGCTWAEPRSKTPRPTSDPPVTPLFAPWSPRSPAPR